MLVGKLRGRGQECGLDSMSWPTERLSASQNDCAWWSYILYGLLLSLYLSDERTQRYRNTLLLFSSQNITTLFHNKELNLIIIMILLLLTYVQLIVVWLFYCCHSYYYTTRRSLQTTRHSTSLLVPASAHVHAHAHYSYTSISSNITWY